MINPIKNFVVIVQKDSDEPKCLYQYFYDVSDEEIFSAKELLENIIIFSDYQNENEKMHYELMSQLYFDTDEVKSKFPSVYSNDFSAILAINANCDKEKTNYFYEVKFVNSYSEMELSALEIESNFFRKKIKSNLTAQLDFPRILNKLTRLYI